MLSYLGVPFLHWLNQKVADLAWYLDTWCQLLDGEQ